MNSTPIVRDVCLVGGGHSHALLIRRWAMRPLPGVRLTLISSDSQTPYSGMLPGLIAGHYDVDDIHVDLRQLCTWAGVRFIENTMTGLGLDARCVLFENRPNIGFDVLSLDTGSTPDLSIPGSDLYTTPVKPVHNFYTRWRQILARFDQHDSNNVSIGVVGSGAGGFELVTAMCHALPSALARCYWFIREDLPVRGRPDKVGRLALEAARRQGVEVITYFDVKQVENGKLIAQDGRVYEMDEILWCTAATGPDWPRKAGISVDDHGFVATNAYLQSVSHPFVFATGDIGTQVQTPSAKAGVFAVRQAPVLIENLRRFVLDQPLVRFTPQKDFLSLMATGDKQAIASRGPWAIEGSWVWRWKDHIDKTFMRQLKKLPVMNTDGRLNRLPDTLRNAVGNDSSIHTMQCKGCGAKVGGQILDRVLASHDTGFQNDADSRYSPAGDTAVITIQAGKLVQSVDQINAIVDDPYCLGRIAALHALSDVVTLDATLHSAQVLVTLPRATASITERDLSLLMTGLVETLNAEGCALIGGHTSEGDEMTVGLVINATLNTTMSAVEPAATAAENDVLVLTQAIGSGVLFAGLMQQKTHGRHISSALQSMQTSNTPAAGILRQHGAYAMTDVTGFGLLGHLERLLTGADTGAALRLASVPILQGAKQLAEQGVRSTLWSANSQVLERVSVSAGVNSNLLSLMCDPQTGGGLLAMVPAAQQADCIAALVEANYTDASVIGVINKSSTLTVQ